MKGTGGTKGTGTGPVPPGPLSVNDAADLLGITPRAVRKRIAAGTLYAQLIDGGYKVFPEFQPTKGTGTAPGSPEQFRSSAEPRNRAAELLTEPSGAAAVMERLVAPLVAQIAAQGVQIGDLREQLGRLEEQRDQACRDADELRRQLSTHAATSAPPSAAPPSPAPHRPPDRRRPRSLLGQITAYAAARLR